MKTPPSTHKTPFPLILPHKKSNKTHENPSQTLRQELRSHYLSPQEKKLRKETIRVFFKPNDLEYYNMNNKHDILKSSLNRDSSIQEVFLSKKKSEQVFKTVKSKGNIYINDLWSEDYYKKVMKFAHLQEIIDDIKENQRKKNLIKKEEIKKQLQMNFSLSNKKMSFFDHKNNNNFDEEIHLLQRNFKKNPLENLFENPSENSSDNHLKNPLENSLKKPIQKPLKIKGFLKEKIADIRDLINDCNKYGNNTREFEENLKGICWGKSLEKLKKKDNDKRFMKDLTVSLVNFFELKRRTSGMEINPLKVQEIEQISKGFF